MNYFLNLATAALAFFQLAKDWNAHKSHWRRGAVLFLLVVFVGLSTWNTFRSNKHNIEQLQKAAADAQEIAALHRAVEGANTAQRENTKLFVEKYGTLLLELNELKSELKKAGLQDQADKLRTDLATTRTALAVPQANLSVAFGHVLEAPDVAESKVGRVQSQADESLSFGISVFNSATVQAKNGTVVLKICDGCVYVGEPNGTSKAPGAPDQDRTMNFPYLSGRSGLYIELKIKPPAGFHSIDVAVKLTCENCEFRQPSKITVNY